MITFFLRLLSLQPSDIFASEMVIGEDSQTSTVIKLAVTEQSFKFGESLAELIGKRYKYLKLVVNKYTDPIEITNHVCTGIADMCLIKFEAMHKSLFVACPDENDRSNVNGLMLFPGRIQHIIATEKSGIKSINDLKGKRVAITEEGIDENKLINSVLTEYDLDRKINRVSADFPSALHQMKLGTVDAAFFYANYPSTNVIDLSRYRGIEMLPLNNSVLIHIEKLSPRYDTTTVIPVFYAGVQRKISTVGVPASILLGSRSLNSNLFYKIVHAIAKDDPEKAKLTLQTLNGEDKAGAKLDVELHPAAIHSMHDVLSGK